MRAFPFRPLRFARSAGALALLLALTAFGSSTAQAQYGYEAELLMPPRAVVWRLNERGFTEVTRPRFDGRAYIVEASNPYGERVRLFVDGLDGRILGRQRLDSPPPMPPARVVRRTPGYGWTEEDESPRRPIREAERIVPPADIPFPQTQPRRSRPDLAERPDYARPDGRSDLTMRPVSPVPTGPESPDRNPLGLNPAARAPEAKPKGEAPRKVVRLNPQPAKPPAPADKPAVPAVSPKLSDVPPSMSAPDAKSGAASAALAPPNALTPATSATSTTPAAVQPPPADKAAQNWKDVPAEAKRPVRVIGGATIVPGTTAKDADKD